MNTEIVFDISKNCAVQKVEDGAVILRLSDGQIYSCNETTQLFLKLIDGRQKLNEVIQLFCEEYAIDESTALQDLCALAQDLLAEGIICEVT